MKRKHSKAWLAVLINVRTVSKLEDEVVDGVDYKQSSTLKMTRHHTSWIQQLVAKRVKERNETELEKKGEIQQKEKILKAV